MSGLDRIIEKIGADAESVAAGMIEDAKIRAARIISSAEEEGDLQAKKITENAKSDSAAMIERAKSAGELLGRKQILKRKVDIIDATIAKSVGIFLRENPKEYFDGMVRLLEEYAASGEQTMIFSDRDLERLPEGFEKRANAAVKGAKITVKGGGGFDGGFLLINGEIVENCTINALISHKETQLRDEIHKILFG